MSLARFRECLVLHLLSTCWKRWVAGCSMGGTIDTCVAGETRVAGVVLRGKSYRYGWYSWSSRWDDVGSGLNNW